MSATAVDAIVLDMGFGGFWEGRKGKEMVTVRRCFRSHLPSSSALRDLGDTYKISCLHRSINYVNKQ